MSFRWALHPLEDELAVDQLREALGVSDTIARLLALRGITTFDDAKFFFRPQLDAIHNPFLMKDMDKAATRLAQAIQRSEKITVYGDYDVDGTTATSIMYTFLKTFGNPVEYYIPHRFKEGYGISEDGITFAHENGATVIVSVDCGITAINEAKVAKSLGIDLIICDHHNAADELPDALAVLDPKRHDCSYPFDGLSGAGVAFKLIQATTELLGLPASVAYKYLDLVAISIASDIVPIIDENRVLMREGLKMLNTEPRVGIKALMDLIKMEVGSMTTTQIVFSLGPRINAAGRLGDAKVAVQLLIAENEDEAKAFAHELEAINIRRRSIDNETMEEAMAQIDKELNLDACSSLVLHSNNWHLGVIGIVASRLVDKYNRPAIMLSTVDGMIKGSARSIKGFNVYNALKQCDDLLEQFGGHEYAAGLTMRVEQLNAFRERFNRIVKDQLCNAEFLPELCIDAELQLNEVKEGINSTFWKQLRQFEPFGPNNMKPVFMLRDVRVVGTPTVVGNGHLKFRIAQNGSGEFDAIGFSMHEYLPAVREHSDGGLHLAFCLEENTWGNRKSIQLRIKDIKTGQLF